MLFSCKITNAVINSLEASNADLSFVYESNYYPLDMLQDPSAWISAPEMENFLNQAINSSGQNKTELIQRIGHETPKLHAWGVLDSVLKMISHPVEVFKQPDRFLSYFISPEPPVENLVRSQNNLSFDVPLIAEQYPLVAHYLTSAFEALPLYSGKGLARCRWQHIHWVIEWPEQSQTLIKSAEESKHLSAAFLQNIIEELQVNQKNLEIKNRELMQKNQELLAAHKELGRSKENPQLVAGIDQIQLNIIVNSDLDLNQISQNLARLHDYMVRAQQLITLLTGQIKMNAGLKEVMRRIDWDHVKSQYPLTIMESMEVLKKIQKKN